jgi:hypothetical protein
MNSVLPCRLVTSGAPRSGSGDSIVRAREPGQRRALALVVVSGGLAVPASAQAATLVIPPCSVSLPGERTIPITGSGFAPNSFVSLTADGQSFTSVQADAAGNIAVAATTPVLRSINTTQQTFRVAADDRAGNTAAAPMRLTRVGADLPDRARPSSRVRMRVFGFAPGRVVYLHIRRAGRTRGTFRIGTVAGALRDDLAPAAVHAAQALPDRLVHVRVPAVQALRPPQARGAARDLGHP